MAIPQKNPVWPTPAQLLFDVSKEERSRNSQQLDRTIVHYSHSLFFAPERNHCLTKKPATTQPIVTQPFLGPINSAALS